MNYELRPARADELHLAFGMKRDAIGPHITTRWGWDETFQLQLHQKRWEEKPWQIICVGEEPVGTVSIDFRTTHLQFGEFYIMGAYRGQGLGSVVLQDALREADIRGKETRLEYLKWNPVASLYARHGFKVVAENDIHYFLVRAPHEA
jgi:GNAT superfamily N-acetyltransferase